MNNYIPLAIACLVANLWLSKAFAQQSYNEMVVVAGMAKANQPQDVAITKSANPYKSKSASYYRHHKRLPATFKGYAIELAISDKPKRRDDELFRYFGNIFYKQLDSGQYAYYILLDFGSKKAREAYLENIIRHRVAGARLVRYVKGKCKPN